jgi:hypothetical protein
VSLDASPRNPVEWNIRSDGRLEFMCKHGVGHTVSIPPFVELTNEGLDAQRPWWAHGCDGCCGGWTRIERNP